MWSDDDADSYYDDEELSDVEEGLNDVEDLDQSTCETPAKVITGESLAADQSNELQRVMEMLGVGIHQARTLLIHYRWSIDSLFQEFVELGKERIFVRAGLPVPVDVSTSSSLASSVVTCEVCFDDVAWSGATQMSCGHAFCNDCWFQHLSLAINEAKSRRLSCMREKCTAICDEDKVRLILQPRDNDLLEKYDQCLGQSYIEDNPNVRWCPSAPHCGNAIKVEESVYCEVKCICSKEFCFNCAREPHSPCSCEMWKLWSRSDNETQCWLSINTKPCPKCKKMVEKDGGCNHVTCVCGYFFCWLCGEETGRDHTYTGIMHHSCGKFTEDKIQNLAIAEKQLVRFKHYEGRWMAHRASMKLDSSPLQVEKLQFKRAELESLLPNVVDYSWLTKCIELLRKARNVLSISYVFAYYMFGGELFSSSITPEQNTINQNLFEYQQQRFEERVEQMSGIIGEFIREELDEDKLTNLRCRLISAATVANERCERMYSVIENQLLENTSHHIAKCHVENLTFKY